MKAKGKVSSASLVIFCLLVIAVSSAAQTSSKTRKNSNETVRTNSSVERDRKVVADLDTQYQQAVKMNDAATMDRILADDFVLVTGKGKVFRQTLLA